MLRLKNKVAIITGGGNGLGAAIATRMSEEGAAIFILDLDNNGKKIAAQITNSGGKAGHLNCDVSREDQVIAGLDNAIDMFGHVDILVNNAAIEGPNLTTEQFSLADWERVFSVNTTGVFLCTKHVVPLLRKNNGGAIINISSIYGLVGGGDVSAYHASKGAVRLMSKNDAISFAPDKIRVNSIHPGFIPTSMVERFVDGSGTDLNTMKPILDEKHPLEGMGHPDDIAWAAVYLASDQARWVTGTELIVDGGYTAR